MENKVQAAGVIIFARSEPLSFLLLKHKDRWDFPKGHAEQGEEILDTALRETEEETGIPSTAIDLDSSFSFQIEYPVNSRKRGLVTKQVTYFLGFVEAPCDIEVSEHIGYEWRDWPVQQIQAQTIDPALDAVRTHFENSHTGDA